MSLNATNLKNQIITDLSNITNINATKALSTLGNTIADYIKNNAEVSFSWSATNPSGTSDPVTTASGEIVSISFSLSVSGAITQSAGILQLQTDLISGLSSSTYNITDIGFSTSTGLMSTSPSISTLSLSISGSTQDEAIGKLATQIVSWVKSQVPTGPCSGSHGAYTGAGTVSTII